MNLRVTTFNLFQYCSSDNSFYVKKDKYNKNEWISKNNWIKNTLTTINSDIIGFQEVFCEDKLKELTSSLGYKYFANIDLANKSKNIYSSCVVSLASKYPIKSIGTINENKNISNMFNFENEFSFQRKPLKVKLEINNEEYLVYLVHLKSNRLNEFEYKFEKETCINEKLQKSIDSFNFKNANALQQRLCEAFHIANDISTQTCENIILMGDLNDKEFSLSTNILTSKTLINEIKDFKKFKNIDLSNNELFMFDTFYESSNYKTRPYTSYYKTVGNVLDYIFVSKNLKEKFDSYEIFNFHLRDNQNGSLLNSDHAIVTTQFKI